MVRVHVEQTVLASPSMPAILRHVRIRGSNPEIGQAVAELAIADHGIRAEDLLGDVRYVRARRSYFQRTYPIHFERMRGVANAFGLLLEDDRFDFSVLRLGGPQSDPANLTGTASYSPPWSTEDGHGCLIRDSAPLHRDQPLMLHLMEWHSGGTPYGSIAVHVDDMLSGAIAGINAARLVVCAVASGDSTVDPPLPRGPGSQAALAVGLHELGIMRFVLDMCRTVDDAQAALLAAQAFPMTSPARYLVADGNGRSFVYEASLDRRIQKIVDGGGDPQTISSLANTGERASGWWRCVVDQEHRSLEIILQPQAVAAARPGRKSQPANDADNREEPTVRISASI